MIIIPLPTYTRLALIAFCLPKLNFFALFRIYPLTFHFRKILTVILGAAAFDAPLLIGKISPTVAEKFSGSLKISLYEIEFSIPSNTIGVMPKYPQKVCFEILFLQYKSIV